MTPRVFTLNNLLLCCCVRFTGAPFTPLIQMRILFQQTFANYFTQRKFFDILTVYAYLNRTITAIVMRHKRRAKPPLIKPIRVFVIHVLRASLLLCFSMGSIPRSEGRLDVKLISVLSNLGAVVGGDAVSGGPVVTPERIRK